MLDGLFPPDLRSEDRGRARLIVYGAPAAAVALTVEQALVGPAATPLGALGAAAGIALLAVPFLLRALGDVRTTGALFFGWTSLAVVVATGGAADVTPGRVAVAAGVAAVTGWVSGPGVAGLGGVALAVALTAIGAWIGEFGAAASSSIGILVAANVAWLFEFDARDHQRRAEEAEARLDVAMSDGLVGVFLWNLPTEEVVFSPRFREVLGYDPFASFPPLPQYLLSPDLLCAEDYERVREELNRLVDQGVPLDVECRFLNANGEPHWVRLYARLSCDVQGRPERITGSIQDISARRDAEELADRFVHLASQEFRGPLTSIRGVHRLMTGGAFGELPRLATRMLGIAERNSAQLETLVEQLLELRRLRRATARLEFVAVDVDALLVDVVAGATGAVGDLGVAFSAHEERVEAAIGMDRARLTAALVTLLTAGADQVRGAARGSIAGVRQEDRLILTIERVAPNEDHAWHRDLHRALAGEVEDAYDPTTLAVNVARAVVEAHGGLVTSASTGPGTLRVIVQLPDAQPMGRPTPRTGSV